MIRSTFSGFTMAQLALQYNQKGLDVAGQNATNARTPGYTRQRIDTMSMNLSGLSNFYMTGANPNVGFGVQMTGISQLRDKFIDVQYRDQSAKLSTTEAINRIQDLLKGVYDETDKKAIMEHLSKVRSSLSNYSTQVGKSEHESIVRSEFQSLINLLYRNHVDLQKTRQDLQPSKDGQSTMSLDVAKVNDLIKNIARISKQITMSRTLGNPALELLDQRNLLIDELSKYLPITVKYKDRVSASEPDEKSAFVDYITITLNDGDNDPTNDIVLLKESQQNIRAREVGGEMVLDEAGDKDIGDTLYYRQVGAEVMKKGATNAAGENIEGKTKFYVSGVTTNAAGVPSNNGAKLNKGIFTVGSEKVPRVFNGTETPNADLYDVSGVHQGYNHNNALAQGKFKGVLDMLNKEGTFDNTNVNGLGYYEKSLDLLVDKLVRVFNGLNTPKPLPAGKTELDYNLFDAELPANKTFTKDVRLTSDVKLKNGDKIPAGTIFKEPTTIGGTTYPAGVPTPEITLAADYTVKAGTVFPANSQVNAAIRTDSVPFTAGNVRISEGWRIGKNKLTASKEADPGSKQNENILAMIAAMDAKREFNFKKLPDGSVQTTDVGEPGGKPLFKGSFQEYYTNIGVTLGVDKRSTDSLKKSQSSVKDAIAHNKDQVSGVDTNEETISMIQFNKAYSAASRVMTAMDEMLETLMNTGRVGR